MKSYSDPCEWDPVKKDWVYEDEVHAEAEWIIGAKRGYRLCSACASLPEFKRYRKRIKIK